MFAVFGALIREMISFSPLLFIVIAPLVEETLKPMGVLWLMEKRKHLLHSRIQIIVLCQIGAFSFATLENLLYFLVAGTRSSFFIFWRLTICTTIHLLSTFLVSLGLCRYYQSESFHKPGFEFEDIMPWLIAAAALHGFYNLVVFILESAGVLSFR